MIRLAIIDYCTTFDALRGEFPFNPYFPSYVRHGSVRRAAGREKEKERERDMYIYIDIYIYVFAKNPPLPRTSLLISGKVGFLRIVHATVRER